MQSICIFNFLVKANQILENTVKVLVLNRISGRDSKGEELFFYYDNAIAKNSKCNGFTENWKKNV